MKLSHDAVSKPAVISNVNENISRKEFDNEITTTNKQADISDSQQKMFFDQHGDAKLPTKETLELVDWLRKMARTRDLELLDSSPVDANAKEFLFPCSKDEHTVSDTLKVSLSFLMNYSTLPNNSLIDYYCKRTF